NVELHIHASQWKKHEHGKDLNYNNVILHVVWENDESVQERNIPTLILQDRVSILLLQKYNEWMESSGFIHCQSQIEQVNGLVWPSWKDRLLAERMHRKAAVVEQLLKENNDHWEETIWWLIAGNFGTKVNSAAFEAMARTLPVPLLAKHKNNLVQLEAML